MTIYTKVGDKGKTLFFGCGMIQKDDPRIEALGSLDELNSLIGLTLCSITDEKLKQTLNKIQNDLFQAGADLIGSYSEDNSAPKITAEHVQEIELLIDKLQLKLGLPEKFILPGGTLASSFLHLCRATTRRTERNLVKLKNTINLNPEMLCYINRLSDLLYVLAREANKEFNVKEQQPIYKYFKKLTGLDKKEPETEVYRE